MNILKINKGLLFAIIGLIFLSGLVGYQIVEARFLDNNPVEATVDAKDNVATRLTIATSTTESPGMILVDKSDTTNFPHLLEGAVGIEVAGFYFDWVADSAATTTAKVGVAASTTDAGDIMDVYWFDEVSFSTDDPNGDGRQSETILYSPSVISLGLSSGAPSGFLTNDTSKSTTAFATTTSLDSPNGKISPGVGDLVMLIHDQQGTASTSVTTIYRTR